MAFFLPETEPTHGIILCQGLWEATSTLLGLEHRKSIFTVSAVGKGSYLRFLNTGMTKSDLIVGKTILLVVRTTSLL